MKHIKLFEEFDFKNLFKSKKDKLREEMFSTKDFSKKPVEDYKSKIMVDCKAYDTSQFGQDKFGVYIENNGKTYYIGDIREFTKASGPNPYLSYLNIDRVREKEPSSVLCKPNADQMKIIEQELSKDYVSNNLMDDTITYIEFLKGKGVLN